MMRTRRSALFDRHPGNRVSRGNRRKQMNLGHWLSLPLRPSPIEFRLRCAAMLFELFSIFDRNADRIEAASG